MKHLKAWLALPVVVALTGCASRIPSEQLDFDNGLAYKHGSTTPYTGIVDFDRRPDFVREISGDTIIDHHFYLNLGKIDHCAVSFRTGAIEGHSTCYNRQGHKALSFTIHRGRLDGTAIRYNQDGDVLFDTSWRDGALEGKQRVYNGNGRHLVHAWTVRHGYKRGEEVRYTYSGDDLADGTWGSDGKFTGTLLLTDVNSVFTYKDGVRDGPFKKFTDTDDDKVQVEGSYKDGQPSGTWTFHGQSTFFNYGENQLVIRNLGFTISFYDLTNLGAIRTLQAHWKGGHLDGPLHAYDKDKNLILAFRIKDGQIMAPLERYDPASDKKVVITNPAVIAALNYTTPVWQRNQRAILYDPTRDSPERREVEAREQAEDVRDAEITYAIDPFHHSLPAPAPSTNSPSTGLTLAAPPASNVPTSSNDPAPPSAMASQEVAGSRPAASASASSSTTTAPGTASEDCVMSWVTAYRKEMGQDVIVTQDQLSEWQQWCHQGKHPSAGAQ